MNKRCNFSALLQKITFVRFMKKMSATEKKLRALAVVLPQFHPIPENDAWWGKGFTEWTNVAKAKPFYKGHYQPHLPADLGFYDLRLPQAREAQAHLAKAHSIHGFCYYHYWFNGKRLLERPVDEILKSKEPNFPFMLCWANENWSRRWDGKDAEILLKQEYSQADHRAHAQYLAQHVFADDRYIKIDGKPFFLFYNTHIIPDLNKTIETWRTEVRKHGFNDIYLGGIRTSQHALQHAESYDFDIVVDWQPDWDNLNTHPTKLNKLGAKLGLNTLYRKDDYASVVEKMKAKETPAFKHLPSIFPSWDNSARRKSNAMIIDGSTPELYKNWLAHICETFIPPSRDENFLFINAWNEWAEGNHLEPDQKWGKGYLEATKEVLEKYK